MRNLARDAGLGGGILTVSVTLALTTAWVLDLRHDRDHYRGLAARPRPTPTITRVIASPSPPAPTPAPTRQPGPQTTLVAARPPGQSNTPDSATTASRSERPVDQASRPATSPSPARCGGRLLAVRLLGDCTITLGGSR